MRPRVTTKQSRIRLVKCLGRLPLAIGQAIGKGAMTLNPLWGALVRPNLPQQRKQWTGDEAQRFSRALRLALPGAVVWTEPDRLISYAYDATGERHWPDAVVFVRGESDIAPALVVARTFGVPVIGRGAGTSLSGGTTPIRGGIVLAFSAMRTVGAVDEGSHEVVVEPGIVNAELQEALAVQDLLFAPDPSSHRISTIGGNVSENSGGPHCVKYGVTTNHVLGGRVVLSDGIARALPTTRDWRSSLDVTGLVVGSEGTLAVLTEVLVNLRHRTPSVATMLAAFASLDQAADAVSDIIAQRITPSTLELLDRPSIETIERFAHAGYPQAADAVLLIEVDGATGDVDAESRAIEAILAQRSALTIERAQTQEAVDALWKGRRAAYGAMAQIAGHLWVQDVTVPRPLLAEMIRRIRSIGQDHAFDILTIAHAGDGNVHPNLPYDPSDADEVQRMREADQDILKACVELGGSITGEHGIGIDKLEQLALMYGPDERRRMAELKAVFDPNHLLNPGKAVLPIDYVAPASFPSPPTPDGDERCGTMLRALQSGKPITIEGSGSQRGRAPQNERALAVSTRDFNRIVELDAANLTVTVEAGVVAADLFAALSDAHLYIPTLAPSRRTIGGLVASNARYWLDPGLGWRDHVVALDWLDGGGTRLRFGRKTVKNVAGYDVSKLAVGSWGRLGLITRLTLRLCPAPEQVRVAKISGPPANDLMRLALDLRNSPLPPRGLLLAVDTEAALWVWMEGRILDDAERMLSELNQHYGAIVSWRDCSEVTAIDQGHDSAWHDAVSTNARGDLLWIEGGTAPGNLLKIIDELPEAGRAYVYPSSGSVEWLQPGKATLPTWARRWQHGGQSPTVRLDPAWKEIETKIARVFDPAGVFSDWTVWVDG